MKTSKEEVLAILQRAINAPSGDNAQPWRFRVADESVEIFNLTDADPTIYNYLERGSYIAIGAVAENIRILASEIGRAASIRIFPEGAGGCVVRISLTSEAASVDPLVEHIEDRSTNRAPYADKDLPVAVADALVAAAKDVGSTLRLVQNDDAIRELSRAISTNELLLMENRGLHDGIFSMIRFSRRAEMRAPGMYIKTMDLPLPVEMLFRSVLRSWNLLTLMNRAGFSRTIPEQTAPIYRASSAYGAIVLAGRSDADYVAVGRALQRVWLTAVSHGLAMQPTAAIPYLAQRVDAGAASMFNDEHISLIRQAYAVIARAFGISDSEHVGMMFRIGYATRKVAHSRKLPPIVLA